MDTLDIIRLNLLSPMTLSFVLGVVAALLRSDLKFPEPVYAALSIYLLLAIGMKGGAALAVAPLADVAAPGLGGIALGLLIPLWAFAALRRLGGFAPVDAAAIAAHYGSVSAVTFIAAIAYVQSLGHPAEGFMPAVLAVMEVPAIVVALLLAREGRGGGAWRTALHEVLAGRSIVLLAGGLAIGFLAGPQGYAKVAPFFAEPFQGALCLFLLELGMIAAARLREARHVGSFLVGFALLAPLANGALGVALGRATGLSLGGSAVLGTLAASASYIAAPAAVRLALPAANPGYYLTASLAITFPFNLVVGLPIYVGMAKLLFR
ncbi:MAG: sodium-dependent bicarbonate transport family permease [Alphaproteobacteria bacterium]|nr:sodium-dependent bicarbonate transport family permease [Alphaproteobacteria bacterium]